MESAVLLVIAIIVFIIGAPIVALVRSGNNKRRIDELEDRIKELYFLVRNIQTQQGPIQTPNTAEAAPPPATTATPATTAIPVTPKIQPKVQHDWRTEMPPAWITRPAAPPVQTPPPPPSAPPVQPPPPPPAAPSRPAPRPQPQPSPTDSNWEVLIGGNLFNKIGALAIVITMGFLLTYAYQQHWISPQMIAGFGLLVGAVFVVLGNWFHKREQVVFAQGILGAGISILYLSTYALFHFNSVSQPLALLMMSVVTAVAVIQSLRIDSLIVSLLGLAGGFLTPLILSGGDTTSSGSIGLFAYLSLLNVGLLAVVIKKDSWAVIEPLALAATYLTYLVWRVQYYTHGDASFTIPFLTIFWALFFAMDMYRVLKSVRTYPELRMGLATLNTLFYYVALYVDVNREYPDWAGAATLLLCGVFFVSVLVLARKRADDLEAIPRFALTSVVLLIVATGVQFHDYTRAILWAVEAALLCWVGLRNKMKTVWMPGVWLFAVAAIAIMAQPDAFEYRDIKSFAMIANMRFPAYAVLAASLAAASVLFARSEDQETRDVSPGLNLAWVIVVFGLIGIETNDYFNKLMAVNPHGTIGVSYDTARFFAIAFMWMVYSIPLMLYGVRKNTSMFTALSAASLGAGVVVAAIKAAEFEPIANFHPIFNLRVAILIVAAAVIMVHERFAERNPSLWLPKMPNVLIFTAALVGFELVTVETLDYFRMVGLPQIGAEQTKFLALAGVWLIYSLLISLWGIRKHSSLTILFGIVTLALGLVTIAGKGFRYEPIDSFTLLINPRAMVFLIAILVLVIYKRWIAGRLSDYEALDPIFASIPVLCSLLIFELISVETWDFFSRSMSVSGSTLQFHNAHSLRQMALSVVWLVYSVILVGYGMWRRYIPIRIVAMGLFIITILKVFLSDLSFLETIYRIFSFLGLGLILLATSYLYQRYRSIILGTETESVADDGP